MFKYLNKFKYKLHVKNVKRLNIIRNYINLIKNLESQILHKFTITLL